MKPRVLTGTANPALGESLSESLAVEPVACEVERFPDGELRPLVGDLRGDDVFVLQPLGPPVNDHLVELLLLVDACRRAGAGQITAVVPYLGYARQDRRGREGQSLGAHVVAKVVSSAGVDRVMVVDPHSVAVEVMFDVPVEMLTAVPAIARTLEGHLPADAVIVAPDLGAVKLAERYGSLLEREVAIVRKTRRSGSEVRAEKVIGEVAGRSVAVVDDMITTGGTIVAAVRAVLEEGAVGDVVVAATHGLLIEPHVGALADLPLARLVVSDSLPPPDDPPVPLEVVSVSSLLAEAIDRLRLRHPLDDLLGGS